MGVGVGVGVAKRGGVLALASTAPGLTQRTPGVSTGITHIKLPGSKQGTILDESHRSITHGCRQPSHRAYKTICRRGELAAPGSGGGFHHVCTPFQSPGTHLALGCLSSPLMTSRIIATLVLDGARRYAPTLAGIPPGTLPPRQVETPTSWHAAPDVHPS